MIPTSVYTSASKLQRACFFFFIWQHRVLQTFHRFLRSLVHRCVALNSTQRKVLHHDCVTMLQTRFVLLNENFLIRRESITKFLWMTDSVSSRFRAIPARSSGSLCELANFITRIFKNMCQSIVPASWHACVWSLGPLRKKQEERLTLLRSSPSNHQVFSLLAHLQVAPPRYCVSGRSPL